MQEPRNLLDMRGISKSFPGVKALQKVDFSLRPGEIHALIGENGAGKSTLMKVLLGLYGPDEGTILFKGKEVAIHSPHDALKIGISMIHQELSLVPHRTIAENILMGREPVSRVPGLMDWKALFRKARELLDGLGLDYDPRGYVKDLTVAGQQMIEIARALSYNSDIIIMDEPTSAMTEGEVKKLFEIMRTIRASGRSIIFISHKLDELLEIGDRTTVLRDGQLIGVRDQAGLKKSEIISMMVGRELNNIFPHVAGTRGEPFLEVKNLTRKGVFEDISFKVHEGEILGVSGLMGAGRTEVMRAVFGIDPFDSGEVLIYGKKVDIRSPKAAIEMHMGMVTEDRKEEGLALIRSVKENISMATMQNYCQAGFIQKRAEKANSEKMIEMLKVKTPSPRVRVNSLSGGNQQKVVLSKWLSIKPKLLILDEPTRGIDVGAKAEIHRLMAEFVREGMAVIMISSEMPEVLGMSDRILVMHEGHIKGCFDRSEATQEKIMNCAVGEV